MRKRRKSAFSLVEMVIVLAIIGVLAAVMIPTFSGIVTKSNQRDAQAATESAITAYMADNHRRAVNGIVSIVKMSDGLHVYKYDTSSDIYIPLDGNPYIEPEAESFSVSAMKLLTDLSTGEDHVLPDGPYQDITDYIPDIGSNIRVFGMAVGYTSNIYSVSYSFNGGNVEPENEWLFAHQTYSEALEVTLPSVVPTKTGYTFAGWTYSDSAAGTLAMIPGDPPTSIATLNAGDTFIMPPASVTLTAKWTPVTVTVSFMFKSVGEDEYSANANPQTTQVEYGEDYQSGTDGWPTVDPMSVEYDGHTYTFIGWFTEQDGHGNKITATTLMSTPVDHTLYSFWSTGYTVTYAHAGNVYVEDYSTLPVLVSPTAYIATDIVTVGAADAIPGYNFLYWQSDIESEGAHGFLSFAPGETFEMPAQNVSLTSVFAPAVYNVSFNLNYDGASSMDAVPVTYNTIYDEATGWPTNPTRMDGFFFEGWSLSAGGQGGNINPSGEMRYPNDILLYAQWSRETFTVTYDVDPVDISYTVESGSTINVGNYYEGGAIEYTVAAGQYLNQWMVGTTPYANGAEYAVTGNVTFMPDYATEQYNIVYNANGGTFATEGNPETMTVAVTYGHAFSDASYNPWVNPPTKAGYEFTGWYSEDGLTQYLANSEVTDFGNNGATVTLMAHWSAESYSVIYMPNADGVVTDVPNTEQCQFGATYEISDGIPDRKGYDFVNWTASGSVTGNYAPGGTFTMGPGDVFLNANWTVKSYNVTFASEGTTTGMPTGGTHEFGSTVSWTEVPTRSGFIFANWTATKTGDAAVTVPVASVEGTSSLTMPAYDVTVTANWTAATFNVHFDKGIVTVAAGIPSDDIPCTFNAQFTIPSTPPTSDGYTFTGWQVTSGTTPAEGASYAAGASFTMPASDITLTAQWTLNSYTVAFSKGCDDASVAGMPEHAEYLYAYNSTVTWTHQPTRTGYTFAGWTAAKTDDAATVVTVTENSGTYSFTMPAYNVTVTATWTATEYAITYAPGGTNVSGMPANGTCVFGENYTVTATVPTREGFDFSYWMSSENGTHYTAHMQFTMPSHDVVLTAVWDIHTHTVSFDKGTTDEVENMPQGGTCDYGDTFEIGSEIPTRTGWTFLNWSSSLGGTVAPGGTFTMPDADVTLTAQWQINSYTLTYVANGDGVTGMPNPASIGYNYQAQVTVAAAPSRAGYEFGGWLASGAITSTTYSAGNTFNMPAGNVTLTAQWTVKSFSITYSAGTVVTAENIPANTSCNYGVSYPIPNVTPTHAGYEFAGWTASGALSGNYVAGESFTMPAGDVILTAQWTFTTYTIEYNLNGGAISGTYPTSYTVATLPITLINPTKAGYTFAGWTGSNGTTPQTTVTIAVGSTGNRSYTANWTAGVYTITLNAQGGSGTAAIYEKYGVGFYSDAGATSQITTITLPTRTGYTFGGYYTSTGGNGTQYITNAGAITATNTTFTQATTLYAKWTPIQYEISYTLNSGTVSGTNPVSYNIESSPITLIDPTRFGYTFAGWTGSNGSTPQTPVIIPTGSTGNKEYTANWNANVYTITLDRQSGTGGTAAIYEKYGAGFYSDAGATASITSITVPTRTGYTFLGYYTGTGGTGTQYIANTGAISAGNTVFSSNTTLYAHWATVTYTITYNYDGGTATNPGTYTVATLPITLNNPTRSGFAFAGWTGTGLSGATMTVTIPVNSTGNREYTATWTEAATEYTVGFYDTVNNITLATTTETLPTQSNVASILGAKSSYQSYTFVVTGFSLNGVTASVQGYRTMSVEGNTCTVITTETGLRKVGSSSSAPYSKSGNYVMDSDITLTSAWTPLCTDGFTGRFYGGNGVTHMISNMNVSGVAYAGLFSAYGSGYIQNVIINSGTISGTTSAGAIAGQATGGLGEIINCGVNAGVTISSSGQYAGGIVGKTSGQVRISNCYNKASVTNTTSGTAASPTFAAGIACNLGSSTAWIKNCYNTGSIRSSWVAAGIVGMTTNAATIQYCYNSGDIGTTLSGYSNVQQVAAGILGYTPSGMTSSTVPTITYCYNTGLVFSTIGKTAGSAAGIFGSNGTSGTEKGPKVSYCYSVGYMCAYYTGTIACRNGTTGTYNNNVGFKNHQVTVTHGTRVDGTPSYTTLSDFQSGWAAVIGTTYYVSTPNVPYHNSVSTTPTTATLPTFASGNAAGVTAGDGGDFTDYTPGDVTPTAPPGGETTPPATTNPPTPTPTPSSNELDEALNGATPGNLHFTTGGSASYTIETVGGRTYAKIVIPANSTGYFQLSRTFTSSEVLSWDWKYAGASHSLYWILDGSGITYPSTTDWASVSRTPGSGAHTIRWGTSNAASVEQVIYLDNVQVGGSAVVTTPTPTPANPLDVALNGSTPGNLHFTNDATYPWVVDNTSTSGETGVAKSGNAGVNSSTSSITLSVYMTKGQILSFYWAVSSESDSAWWDYLAFYDTTPTNSNYVDRITNKTKEIVLTRYIYTAEESKTYTFTWRFIKDSSSAGGSDCGWVDNVAIVEPLNEFDTAINGSNSLIRFTNSSEHIWSVDVDGERVKSGGSGTKNLSTSYIYADVTVPAGAKIVFDWEVSSESSYDLLQLYIAEGTAVPTMNRTNKGVWYKSGELAGENEEVEFPDAGLYRIYFTYTKDGSGDNGSDCGWVDNVHIERASASIKGNLNLGGSLRAIDFMNKLGVMPNDKFITRSRRDVIAVYTESGELYYIIDPSLLQALDMPSITPIRMLTSTKSTDSKE